jgi:hypothetical protein
MTTSGQCTFPDRSSLETHIGGDALVDAWGIAGVKRAYKRLCCGIIIEPQPVQMPGAEGEAARRDRLLPTGRR